MYTAAAKMDILFKSPVMLLVLLAVLLLFSFVL